MRKTLYYQRGYGGIEMFLAAVVIGLVIYFAFYPTKFSKIDPKEEELTGTYCREIVDPATAPRFTNPENGITYRMVKANVPMNPANYENDRTYNHFGTSQNYEDPTTGKKYVIRDPSIQSRSGRSYQFASDIDPNKAYDIGFAEYGIIMLFHTDDNYNPAPFGYTADVYKAVDKPELPEWVLKCIDEPPPGELRTNLEDGVTGQGDFIIERRGYELYYPEPTKNWSPTKNEEQLGWFLPKTNVYINHAWWTPHCKPAIYLYPEKETQVNVQVAIPQGEFLYTDPVFPKGGWDVLAKPNGELIYLGKERGDSKGTINYPTGVLPYLYYEGKVADSAVEKPEKGFVIAYDKLDSFFKDILPKLGLNEKESREFKDYWIKVLPKASYYFIGIVPQSNLDIIEPLTITPKQDTTIRVTLYFEALEKLRLVTPPSLKTPIRSGFTVVEWGGMLKTDKDHPFTCVQ